MATIEILVREKIATNLDPRGQTIVCDNSDYVVKFDFDEEWAALPEKTARFAYNRRYQDISFKGDKCVMPAIRNASSVEVGVFAGNLHTTTPAVIYANKSIRGCGCAPEGPPYEIYDHIMEAVNEACNAANEVKEAAKSGEFKGDPGKPGFSPTVGVEEISNGHRITITDQNGPKSFDVLDGAAGSLEAGDNIEIKDGRISVLTTDKIEADNTRPVTSAAVQTTVGNIEVYLETI